MGLKDSYNNFKKKGLIVIAVLKNLRSLSEMEFYKNAIHMRVSLTTWLLRDFGTKRNARSVNQVICCLGNIKVYF